MAKTPRLFLIDGSALAYRSYFAFIRNPLINVRIQRTPEAVRCNDQLDLREVESGDIGTSVVQGQR
jgi:hypothetical protein